MNIKAISALEHNYNLKSINRVNTTASALKADVVEMSSNSLSFKGTDKKAVMAYRKLARSHAKDANTILKMSDLDMKNMQRELSMCSSIISYGEEYKEIANLQYGLAISWLNEVQNELVEGDICGNFTYADGTKGSFICFEQDGKKGLTVIKPYTGEDAKIYEPIVATLFGDKLTVTNRIKNGSERIFTYDKGDIQTFEQIAGGYNQLFKTLEITYQNGEMTEYKEKDSTFSNHYLKRYVCENGKVSQIYTAGYEDAKNCLHSGDAYFLEDENNPVLSIGFQADQNGNTQATEEFTFIKGQNGEYTLGEFKLKMAKNPEGKVEASKIYKYDNNKLTSMSIGQFVSQSGQEVIREHYSCDDEGKPYDVLLNAEVCEDDDTICLGDEYFHLFT